MVKQKVKTASSRKSSSTHWIQRQINDPFVKKSVIDGYRSRAAYKLIEINKKFSILKSCSTALDLGSAPGGWSQVASEIVGKSGKVFAIDKIPMLPIENVEFFESDINDCITILTEKFSEKKFDAIISDMAPNTSGNSTTDSIRSIEIAKLVVKCATDLLRPGGSIVIKIFRGSEDEHEFLKDLKCKFSVVKHFKPLSSRKESREIYLVLK